MKVTYDKVSEFSGHQHNEEVELVQAARDIFDHVKTKAMQCAVKGNFITFETVEELETQLKEAVQSGYSIKVFDEVIGG